MNLIIVIKHMSVQTTSSSTFNLEEPLILIQSQQLQSTMQPCILVCSSSIDSLIPSVSWVPYVGKKPIKIKFSCFGRLEDNSDTIHLEKCHDYPTMHPVSDDDLIALLRNVLHGTARDLWDVARLPHGRNLNVISRLP